MRYLTGALENDLREKMVMLSGPRQTGKTWLARYLCQSKGVYLNWDVRKDQRIIREIAWPKTSSLVVLEELHKYRKWKNFLKGIADEFNNKPPLLVTGSARLEAFRHAGDALTGRYYQYRLHPIDVAEARVFMKNTSAQKRLARLLKTGGFPEAFLKPEKAEKLRNDRFDLVVQEDLRDLSKTNSVKDLKLLIELLRERVGSNLNYANLAQDLNVAPNTVKAWVDLLEKLYIIFLVSPYSRGLARSLRREPKIYFYDCAAAYSDKDEGAILENAVACALLKYCHFQRDAFGRQTELYYFRDREKREVDFVVTKNRKVLWCIEVKSSEDKLSPHLEYLHTRVKPEASIQIVKNLKREKEIRGIKITVMAEWLDSLYSKTNKRNAEQNGITS